MIDQDYYYSFCVSKGSSRLFCIDWYVTVKYLVVRVPQYLLLRRAPVFHEMVMQKQTIPYGGSLMIDRDCY
jgi:hypothetical protein